MATKKAGSAGKAAQTSKATVQPVSGAGRRPPAPEAPKITTVSLADLADIAKAKLAEANKGRTAEAKAKAASSNTRKATAHEIERSKAKASKAQKTPRQPEIEQAPDLIGAGVIEIEDLTDNECAVLNRIAELMVPIHTAAGPDVVWDVPVFKSKAAVEATATLIKGGLLIINTSADTEPTIRVTERCLQDVFGITTAIVKENARRMLEAQSRAAKSKTSKAAQTGKEAS